MAIFKGRVKDLAKLIMDADLPARLQAENNMLRAGDKPRWIADLKTLRLSERQSDGSYRDAYKMVPLP